MKFKFETSKKEIIDILKAWIVVSISFAVILGDRNILSYKFLANLLLAAVTVGVGFLFHELSHKVLAQKYGAIAEFRSFDVMLVLALVMSFFLGMVFAAPGAVMIAGGNINIKKYGKISAAGPIINLILALMFFALSQLNFSSYFNLMGSYGFFVNSWLALFNMIPFWEFDGRKIFMWSKTVWVIIVAIASVFLFVF